MSKTLYWFSSVVLLSMVVVKIISDRFLCDSNYDKKFYRRRFCVPTDSSPDLEGHPYGPKDPRVLPQ